MKGCKKSKLSRYVLAALTVGMFSMVPVAYALPVAITDGSYTNVGGANISTNSVTKTMGISSGSSHNVMNWKTFSIANGEKVQFDTNNYLNLVRGASKSEINGALTGGGTIYLINPNGILFGSTAQVNVGNLVASTRAIDKVDQSVFSGGGNPLATAATTAAGDIINLGKLQTTSLVLEGNNITIQNAADITSNGSTPLTSAVTAKAAGIITVGHAVAETTTRSFTIGGTATDKTVHDYKNATVAASGYTAKNLAGNTDNAVKESMLVENVYDLQNMDAKLDGSYMLSGNIDASETSSWSDAGTTNGAGFSPVGSWGSKFTGSFDGAGRTISGLTINRSSTDNVGLFGYVNGSVIQSVGLVGGSITGESSVGGVAGQNYSGTITNAYNTGAVSGNGYVGGVAGYNDSGTITNVYNTGAVSGNKNYVGGVAGWNNGTITNVYNTGAVSGSRLPYVGGVVGQNSPSGKITNAYNTGAVSCTGNDYVGGVAGDNSGTITNVYNTGTVRGIVDSVTGFPIFVVGGVVGGNGGTITNAYNTGAVSGNERVGGVVGYNNGTITNAYNTGAVSGNKRVGGVAGENQKSITNAYNTGAVSGTSNIGGVAGYNEGSTITNTWYATTDAAGKTINQTKDNNGAISATNIGTGKTLAELQDMALGDTGYGFDTTIWRKNDTDGSTALVATTPMLQAFINKELDSQIAHDKVQYGTAEKPLVNIYQTTGAVTVDYASLSLPGNVGAYINNDLTINNFAPGAGDTSSWGSGTNLTLKNDNGFTINKNMELLGTTSITLSAKDSSTGTIIDYGKNTTPTLAITAKDIVLDTDRVDTSASNAKTAVTLNAAGTAKAGYTPTGTMAATVNGASVSVPGYDNAAKRTYYPTITATNNNLSEGQWIKNVTELQAMGTSAATLNKKYFLYGDIDASATKSWNAGAGFSPVGNDTTRFSGTFDGLNHTINGLTINRSATDDVGLFGTSSGTIQNVGLVGGSITGQNYVGGVLGENYGTITNVYNTGAVSGTQHVGGVVGSINSGAITNAYNTGAVSGDYYVGGVAGENYGTITNVYNTGAVSGTQHVGGVAGYIGGGTITNAYNTGAVSGASYVGGVLGYNASSGTIKNALWAKDLSYETETGKSKPTKAVGNVDDSDTVKSVALADMKKAATYNSWSNDGDDTIDSTVASEGNKGTAWRIYEGRTTPLLTSFFKGVVTVTGLKNKTVTYNGTTQKADFGGVTYSLANIDTSHILTGDRNVGTYSAVYSDQQGYDLVDSGNTTLTINPKTLTATLTGKTGDTYAFTKTYDGTQSVAQGLALDTTYTFVAGDVISGDTVSIAANSSGTYANKNVGDGKTIEFNGITLTGTDAGNYTITGTLSGNVGQITKKDIYAGLSGKNSFSKIYDGNTDVTTALTLDVNYNFGTGDIESSDSGKVGLAITTAGTYNDKNVADSKNVSFKDLTLTGSEAGNYNLKTKDLSAAVGRITQKDLSAALIGTNSFSKEYDGTNAVTTALTMGTNYQFINMVDKDDLKLTGTGIYTDKKVGSDKTVVFTKLGLTGDDAGNYNLESDVLSSEVGQINKKTVAAEIKSGSTITKEYDGTDVVTTALAKDTNYVLNDVVSGDDLSLNASKASGTYTDGKNAGDNLNTKFIGLELTGADKDNYALKDDTMDGNYGKITPKTLMATLVGDNVFTKVYDGTTAVSQALTQGTNYTLDGIVADSDKVSLVGSGVYNDKNAGDNKAITFSGLTLTGTGAGNYTIASTLSGAVGQITKKSLVAEMNNGASFTKVYDGTTAVNTALVLDSNYAFAEGDVVTGDAVSIDAAKAVGAYDSKDVGSNKQVNFTNLALTGADAGNYELLDIEMGITGAGITPKALTATLTGDNVFTKVYDGTTTVSQALGMNYALDGIMADSDKVLLSAGSGAYNDKNTGDNKTVTFSGLTLTGTGAGNYTIASTLSGAVGQITRKTITGTLASGYSFDKVYDGTTTASLGNGYTLSGLVAGDKVPLTAAKGFYDSSAVGNRTVTFSGFSINDGNYLLSMADSLSGTGKITSGSQDHNYNDAISSFFGADHKDGYTIFGGNPEDYVPRAVTKNNGQSYQVGVSQVTQTWYNGPTTITIINGGITLPKDILLGSTYDTRTVVIKGGNGYEI